MKRSLLFLAAVVLLFLAAGCDSVFNEDDSLVPSDVIGITSFGFKSVVSTAEFVEPENESPARAVLSADDTAAGYGITVYVPQDTDLTCLVADISFEGKSISPEPLSVRDWTAPVAFTVSSEDDTVAPRTYTVTVVPLTTAIDWVYTSETFAEFAAEVAQLEAGEYRIRFPEETELSHKDVLLIRDALAKKENTDKLFRIDFTGCTFEANTLPKYAFSLPAKGKGVDNLLSVVLPEGLVRIDGFAFEHCKNLTSVVLPESLQAICEEAFLNCKNIPTVKIREGVDLLGSWVFGNFTREQTVVMDVSEAPKTWSPTWNYKCRAVIEWAKPEATEE